MSEQQQKPKALAKLTFADGTVSWGLYDTAAQAMQTWTARNPDEVASRYLIEQNMRARGRDVAQTTCGCGGAEEVRVEHALGDHAWQAKACRRCRAFLGPYSLHEFVEASVHGEETGEASTLTGTERTERIGGSCESELTGTEKQTQQLTGTDGNVTGTETRTDALTGTEHLTGTENGPDAEPCITCAYVGRPGKWSCSDVVDLDVAFGHAFQTAKKWFLEAMRGRRN